MRRRTQARGISADAAIFVALFLVVQALFTGLASGASADVAAAGIGVVCNSGGALGSSPADQADRRVRLADCCTLGCPMLGGTPPSPAAPALHGILAAVPVRTVRLADPPPVQRAELQPLNTRAPPRV